MKTAEKTKKFKIKFTILVVIFIVVFFGSFMLGRYPVSPPELMKIILSGIIDIHCKQVHSPFEQEQRDRACYNRNYGKSHILRLD